MYGIKRAIKHWWQRRTRGWDDSDTYSLDITIAKFALPRFKRLREIQKERHEESDRDRELYNDIEYYLSHKAAGKDGYICTFVIDTNFTEEMLKELGLVSGETNFYKTVCYRDERYFRGLKAAFKFHNKLWW